MAVSATALPPSGCPEVAPGGCVRDVRGAPDEPVGGREPDGGSVPDDAPPTDVVEQGLAVTIGGTPLGGGCVIAVGRRGSPEPGGQPVMLGLGTGDIAMNELRAAVSAPTCFFNASMSAAALEGGLVLAVALEAAGRRVSAATTVADSGGGVPGMFVRHNASRCVRN